jgi:hypothetical protein
LVDASPWQVVGAIRPVPPRGGVTVHGASVLLIIFTRAHGWYTSEVPSMCKIWPVRVKDRRAGVPFLLAWSLVKVVAIMQMGR